MAEPAGTGPGAGEPIAVLLVDDRPEDLLALETALDGLGLELIRARSGADALRCLLERNVALIVLDVRMPGLDGFETAALIRARDRSRHTPIIFLTAVERGQAAVFHGYETGAVDYLFKPIDPAVLRAKVASFAELHRLQRECVRRGVALAHANAELEAFSGSVAHDVRAPLRSIAGFSAALAEEYAERLDDTGRDYLRRIQAAAGRAQELIDGLLALARVSRTDLRRERVDLSLLAAGIVAELRRQTPGRRVACTLAEGLVEVADPRLMPVLLENLLANAWKYTRDRPDAHVELGAARHGLEWVYFVRDNGVGFPMSEVARLFQPFERLHRREEFEGVGIGLATVARIVRRHGGRVWAAGEPDRGATFSFTLAESPAPGHQPAPVPVAAPVAGRDAAEAGRPR